MNRFKHSLAALSLALALVLSLAAPVRAAQPSDSLEQALEQGCSILRAAVNLPQPGTLGGEWTVLALTRSTLAVPQSYLEYYYTRLSEQVTLLEGVLDKRLYTEYSRTVLALTAIGADPTDVAGYDLLAPLGDFEQVVWQGLNGPVWALLALDSGSYEMPVNPSAPVQATRQLYVDEILSRQLDCGGWNLGDRGGDGEADVDLTAGALLALANYRDQPAVAQAVERGLDCLSGLQAEDGSFLYRGTANAPTIAQVVMALCALGVEMTDSRFVKNGCSPLDALLSFQLSDGSFCYTAGSETGDLRSTEQGVCALGAALRSAKGESAFFSMNDTPYTVPAAVSGGLSGRHPDVKVLPVTNPDITFTDLAGQDCRTAVEALAARGVISGKGGGLFAPDDTMTRAEFAAIVVGALGLIPRESDVFADVSPSAWYAPYVGTAYGYGLINGRSETTFDPKGTISIQEAATLLSRAAVLCGLDTALTEEETAALLPAGADLSSWARTGTAFCLREGIVEADLVQSSARENALRSQVAQMVYTLLLRAQLI